MKNMDYYIRSEQSVYENIIRSRKDLLQKVIQMEKVDYQAIVILQQVLVLMRHSQRSYICRINLLFRYMWKNHLLQEITCCI